MAGRMSVSKSLVWVFDELNTDHNVELDGSGTIQCSGCQIVTPPRKCYRCASCVNYHLCRACYRYLQVFNSRRFGLITTNSQVHDVHPSHVFLVWPEKHGPHTTRTLSDPEMHIGSPGSTEDHDDEEECEWKK